MTDMEIKRGSSMLAANSKRHKRQSTFFARSATLITAGCVVLFLLSGGASLYVAQMRSGVNAQLRDLDERRQLLNQNENNLRSDIGGITSGTNMEARAKQLGFIQITPSVVITATGDGR